MNEQEQTRSCARTDGQGGSTQIFTKGAGSPKNLTGKGAYAKMAAKKLRESYTFPEPVTGACWIPLSQGKFALVDAGDFERANKKIWTAVKGNTTYYAIFREQPSRRTIALHRWILDLGDEGALVDHINFNGLDCRRMNLRICSKTENNRYSRKWRTATSSKFKGVSFSSRNRLKWSAQLWTNGKKYYLGRFHTEEDAARAYDKLAVVKFGPFAHINLPVPDLCE